MNGAKARNASATPRSSKWMSSSLLTAWIFTMFEKMMLMALGGSSPATFRGPKKFCKVQNIANKIIFRLLITDSYFAAD